MTYSDAYRAYAQESLLSSDPVRLTISLYEGAIRCCEQAKQCIETGDILGRSRAINSAIRILSELIVSLDHEKGGEISQRLKTLYAYMQAKLVEAHAKQAREPITEVADLLKTILAGWQQLPASTTAPGCVSGTSEPSTVSRQDHAVYGGYFYSPTPEPELAVSF